MNYKNDLLHGRYVCYNTITGNIIYDANYKDGKKHGLTRGYYSSGKLKLEKNYKDGKEVGECKEYYPSGEIRIKEVIPDESEETKMEKLLDKLKLKSTNIESITVGDYNKKIKV